MTKGDYQEVDQDMCEAIKHLKTKPRGGVLMSCQDTTE